MGWRDLVQQQDEVVVAPWLGGRELRVGARRWCIDGRLPAEHGWMHFFARGRAARLAPADATQAMPPAIVDAHVPVHLTRVRGIPVGDRFIADTSYILPSVLTFTPRALEDALLNTCEPLHLLDTGLDRFQAVYAGRPYEGGPLVYIEPAMPDEAAQEVLARWEDGFRSLDDVKGITPALDVAFRLLLAQRDEAARARTEIERQERMRELDRQGGSALVRRLIAAVDFERAARAALAAGGAELLDVRPGARETEKVVRFRTEALRFECVCHAATLQIVDAGICLQDHRTGRKDDTLLSLESLPSVIREALRSRRLHVFRPVDDRAAYARAQRDDWEEDTPW